MAINEMDARLISQGTQVESVGAEALIPVASGEGQPQSNITLANLADSLGKAVPQQQDAEQVVMTGLYAQTSEGKMVELTNESVARVMARLVSPQLSLQINTIADLNEFVGVKDKTTSYVCTLTEAATNVPSGINAKRFFLEVGNLSNVYVYQKIISPETNNSYIRYKSSSSSAAWTPWVRLDNFGANTKEELASMVAGQLGVKTQQVTLAVGESVRFKGPYAFFVIVCSNATTALVGVLSGSTVSFLHQMSTSKISVEYDGTWGYMRVTNNDVEELTFNVHLFV